MADLLTLENLFTLLMLILLQAVLGFDNLLYISIESGRVAKEQQAWVRRLGIGGAVVLRIVLLFLLLSAIHTFEAPFFSLSWPGVLTGSFNVHAAIVLAGGVFIIYTAIKEIMHLLTIPDVNEGAKEKVRRSALGATIWIILINFVFSFDSVLSAIALTDQFWLMAVAIVISGLLMIWLADHVAEFIQRNRMYEVLGLFILLIVGILLLSEGGHLAGLTFFGFKVEPMAKTTFYFVIFVIVAVDFVQSRYRKKLLAEQARQVGTGAPAAGKASAQAT